MKGDNLGTNSAWLLKQQASVYHPTEQQWQENFEVMRYFSTPSRPAHWLEKPKFFRAAPIIRTISSRWAWTRFFDLGQKDHELPVLNHFSGDRESFRMYKASVSLIPRESRNS